MTTKIPVELSSTPGIADSSNATAITIDSSENVGIGVTSLSQKLEVNGNVGITDNLGVGTGSSSPNSRLQIKKDGTGNYANQTFTNANSTAGITFGIAGSGTGNYLANNAFLLNTGASAFIFGTSDTERMRITSDGKLGIGTTAPDEKLQVDGKLKVSSSFGTNTSVIIQNNDSSDNFSAIGFYSGGTVAGYIFVNGSTNATSYVTSSDYRLKKNINYEFDALDRVKQLKPARFNFIADADTTVDGFIAHEVSDIVPEAITGEKDGEQMQGIDQSKLVPLLTKNFKKFIRHRSF